MEWKMTLGTYVVQRGLLACPARKLSVDPFHVSRVANGERRNDRISRAIEADLNKMRTWPKDLITWSSTCDALTSPISIATRSFRLIKLSCANEESHEA